MSRQVIAARAKKKRKADMAALYVRGSAETSVKRCGLVHLGGKCVSQRLTDPQLGAYESL